MRLPLLGMLLACFCACVPASSDENSGASDEAAVWGGKRAKDEAVVALLGGKLLCSGVLVGRDPVRDESAILTAAHCLHEYFVGKNAPLRAYSGDKINDFGISLDIVGDPQFHPDFNPARITGHDLAIVWVRGAIPDVDPLPLRRKPLDASIVGQRVRTLGYGRNASRLAAMMPVTELRQQFLKVGDHDTNIDVGDSGGPSFLHDEVDGDQIVAITSGVADASDGCYQTRIDVNLPFLEGVLSPAPAGEDGKAP